jgi:hypothetical protein
MARMHFPLTMSAVLAMFACTGCASLKSDWKESRKEARKNREPFNMWNSIGKVIEDSWQHYQESAEQSVQSQGRMKRR